MLIQLLSDLHLETEDYTPSPAPGADLLVLAGDIDAGHEGLDRFAGWPVPVVYLPGNHEFDLRDVDEALVALRARCERLGFTMLHRRSLVLRDGERRLRMLGCIGWSDFLLLGEREVERCMRAANFFLDKVQRSTRHGRPFTAADVRAEGAIDRAWLEAELARGRSGPDWDDTIVVTHFAPSARSADPRYGLQPSTASFCNMQDDLLAGAGLWIHGHVHHQHDYLAGTTRVKCNARGHSARDEPLGFKDHELIRV